MNRYGGKRGRGCSHPRAQGPNNNIYAQARNIIQLNTQNGYNGNPNYTPRAPPPLPPQPPLAPLSSNAISGRANGYSNSNYVVAHRVHQQYSVQVVNPMEHQNHRQPINGNSNNTVGDLTIAKQHLSVAPPSLNDNVQEIPEDLLATAVVSCINGSNGSASNIPASTTTPPETSPPRPTPTEAQNGFNMGSKVQECYNKLGEAMGKDKAEHNAMKKILEEYIVDNAKQRAHIKELQSHISIVEQEKDNQLKNSTELIDNAQREATRSRQELFTWRSNAIDFSEQLDSLKALMSQKDKQVESLNSQIAEVRGENNGYIQRIQQLEQNEKGYVAEVHSKNNAIEQYKLEIRKKNDDLVKVDLRLKDKMKEMKQMDDEMNTMKKELNMEILQEKKHVNELEGSVTDWKNKYTSAMGAAEGYKADKKKLEGGIAKLENTVSEQNQCLKKKDEQILQLTEERNSIQSQKNTSVFMLQAQTKKTKALKTEINELKEKIKEISSNLEIEMQTRKQILVEQMDMYSKPTLLNHLIQQKMQVPPHLYVASVIAQQQRLSSPGPSSPVASEEAPDHESAEQGYSDERLETSHEDTHEVGRKRKHSTSSSGSKDVVRQKYLKMSGNSVSTTEKRDEKNEPGSNQMKDKEEDEGAYRLRISSRRGSHAAVSSSANKNIPVQGGSEQSPNIPNSSVGGPARSDKVRKTGKQNASIRIKIQNPNINLKKSK